LIAHPASPPASHHHQQPAAGAGNATDLASDQKLICDFACAWSAKPTGPSVPISVGWALSGVAAQTSVQEGLIQTANATLGLDDACVYAHDQPNQESPKLMSSTPYCFDPAGPNVQTFVLPRYTVAMSKDKCASRYNSGTQRVTSSSAARALLTPTTQAAPAAFDPAAAVEQAGGGGRKLQSFCAKTAPAVTAAQYTNQVIVTRDVNATDEVSRSNTVVVHLTNCPAGCAGPNSHKYGSQCCVCAANEQFDAVWQVCVKCRDGWLYDAAVGKCASTCKEPAKPYYKDGACQACPTGTDGRQQEYVPATGNCRACKTGWQVFAPSTQCEGICYHTYGQERPLYKAPTTAGGAYSCVPCPATKSDYVVDIGVCLAPCPATKPFRLPGTKTCVAASKLNRRTRSSG